MIKRTDRLEKLFGEITHWIPDIGGPYCAFKDCRVTQDRNGVEFRYSNGVVYTVPGHYIDQCYSVPEGIFRKGKWWVPDTESQEDFNRWCATWRTYYEEPVGLKKHDVSVVRIRRVSWGWKRAYFLSLCVYLSNNKMHTVDADHVPMNCEPSFQFFGGYSDDTRACTARDYERAQYEIKVRFNNAAFRKENFGTFASAKIEDDGKRVVFTLACKERYEIPVALVHVIAAIHNNKRYRFDRVALNALLEERKGRGSKAVGVSLSRDRVFARVRMADASVVCVDTRGVLAVADGRFDG